jgi:cytidylate kinase
MAVVTISRQYGAGGIRVASAVAEALGFRAVDREIAEETARRVGMDPDVVASLDERAPAIMEELGFVLSAAPPLGAGMVTEPAASVALDDRALCETTRAVILSMAEAGGFVIVGRGGQAILRDRPDACHLALVADLEVRVERIVSWQAVDEAEARERCRRIDAERAGYLGKYYGADIADPALYHAVLDTSSGLDDAAREAAAVARRVLGGDAAGDASGDPPVDRRS